MDPQDKPNPQAPQLPAPPLPDSQDSPPDVEVIQPVKTADGLRWHTEPAGERVRVYVTTPSGRQINRVASTEKAGREALREFLRAEKEIE